MKIVFPYDFNKKNHPVCSAGGVQFLPKFKSPVFISVVGGAVGLYGDGVTSFELMIGELVHGYLSANEVTDKINQVLELTTYPE